MNDGGFHQGRPIRAREICHMSDGTNPSLIEPTEDLPGSIVRPFPLADERDHLGFREAQQINRLVWLRHGHHDDRVGKPIIGENRLAHRNEAGMKLLPLCPVPYIMNGTGDDEYT